MLPLGDLLRVQLGLSGSRLHAQIETPHRVEKDIRILQEPHSSIDLVVRLQELIVLVAGDTICSALLKGAAR